MNKIKYLIFTLVLLLTTYNNVYAASCDSNDINRLREIANNVNVSYAFNDNAYDSDGEKIYDSFFLEISGVTNEIYFYLDDASSENYITYNKTNNGIYVYKNFPSGRYKWYIASSNCGNVLRNEDINILSFNVNSLDERCKDEKYSKEDVCDPWYQGDETLDDFIYDETYGIDINNISFLDKLISFISIYYYYFLFGFIVLILIIILLVKRNKERWSLE